MSEQGEQVDVEGLRAKLSTDRERYVPGTPEKYPLARSSLTILEAEALCERVRLLEQDLKWWTGTAAMRTAELKQAEQREKGLREALEGVDDAYEAWRTVPGESIQVVAEAAYKARLALASPEPPEEKS